MALFHCDACGLRKDVSDKYIGRSISCPRCSYPVTVVAEGEENGRAGPLPPPEVRPVSVPQEGGAEAAAGSTSEQPEAVDAADMAEILAGEDATLRPRREISIPIAAESDAPAAPSLMQGSPGANILAGTLSGFQGVVVCLALSCLIFAGRLAWSDFPYAVLVVLASAASMSFAAALRSRVPYLQAGPGIALGAVTAFMVRDMHASFSAEQAAHVLPTIAVGVSLAAFVVGLTLWFVGGSGMGKWVRFIPHQVVGGVLAGIGVRVLLAALEFQDAGTPCLERLAGTIDLEVCLAWAPAFVPGVLMFVAARRIRHHLVSPVLFLLLLIGSLLGVHLVAAPGDAVRASEWTFAAFSAQSAFGPFSRDFLALIDWSVIAGHAGYILALAGLAVAMTMLTLTEVDAETRGRSDLDHEFSVAGQGNILAALVAGVPGSISEHRTLSSWRAGAAGPLAELTAAAVFVAAIVFIGDILAYVPRFVPAAVLVFLGMQLVARWLGDTYAMFTRKDDYAVLVVIFAVTVFFGVLTGLGVGAALAMMILISRYGRVNVVKFALSGATNRSNVERAPSQLKVLREHGGQIYILRLQGFIFLGSTSALITDIRQRIEDESQPRPRFVILDFRLVTGLDSAVATGLRKLRQLADEYGVTLIFTSIPFEVERLLAENGFVLDDPDHGSRTFVDADFALEWCEDRILEDHGALVLKGRTIEEILAPMFPEPALVPTFVAFLERVEVEKGSHAFRQGDASDAMYFIVSGRVNVQLELEGNRIIRLVKMGPGTIFGEMGIYTDAPRSASIVAAEDCVLYRLSKKKLHAIQKQDPMLVSLIHRFVVNRLAERVAEANAKVRDLIK